jgi:putative hemolysin
MILEILGLVICMGLALFMAGCEAALSHSDRLYFEVLKSKKQFSGQRLLELMERPGVVSGVLLGTYLACLILAFFLLMRLLNLGQGPNGFYLMLTSLLFFTGTVLLSFLVRLFFLSFPDLILKLVSLPLWLTFWTFFPVLYLIILLPARFFAAYKQEKHPFLFAGLGFYYQYQGADGENDWEETRTDTDTDNRIFNNALSFKTVRVKECMVPRTEITAVDIKSSIAQVVQQALESGHSKILVYRETLDDILGYCHIQELFKKPARLQSLITSILTVPETMLVSDLLEQFNSSRKSIALVLDEFGGTSGLITREDVIEVIFGEIQDEYDQTEDWIEAKIADNTYLLSARQETYYLNEKYEWGLPEGDYETLGGLLMANCGILPKPGSVVKLPPFTFEVLSVRGTRIEMVRMQIRQEAAS